MLEHKKFRIFHNRIFLTIILLFLLEPSCFERIKVLDNIYRYGSFVITLILIIVLIRYGRLYRSVIWIIAYFGIIFLSTLINNPGNLWLYMRSEFPAVAICLVFSLWMNQNPRILIESFSLFEIYIYINILTIILFPYTGSYYETNWFLGFKNFHVRIIIPIVCMSIFRSYLDVGYLTIRVIVLIIVSAFTFAINGSATSLLGFVAFLGLFFSFRRKEKRIPCFINLKVVLLIFCIAFFVVVVLQDLSRFAFFIENVLEKNLTLSSRTKIWNLTFSLLSDHMIIGYGYLGANNYRTLYASPYNHPHNYLLYNLMTGGIILLITLFVGFLIADSRLRNNTNKIYGKVVLFCLSAFLIMGIAESLTSTIMLYPMLILAIESKKLDSLPYGKSIKANIISQCRALMKKRRKNSRVRLR